MIASLPDSLNLESHLNQFPPIKYVSTDLDKDNILFLLNQLIEVPARNRKVYDNLEENYVPLSSKIMQSNIHNYKIYWEYLEKTGIVEIRKSYRPKIFFEEGKCMGYRFREKYSRQSYKEHSYSENFVKKNEIKRRKEQRTKYLELKSEYGHLLKWIYPACKLKIDIPNAYRFLELERDALFVEPSLRGKKRSKIKNVKEGLKNPDYQFELSRSSIQTIKSGDIYFNVDYCVNRLHTVLTNMNADLRNFIKYEDEELLSIDLGNSQPYLSTILFNKEFWSAKSNKSNKIKSTTSTIYMLDFIRQYTDNEDVKLYFSLVGQSTNLSDFYDFMGNEFRLKGLGNIERKEI
jgi:hypothetical protein